MNEYQHDRVVNAVKKPFCIKRPLVDFSLIPIMKQYLRARGLSYTTADENGWYPSSSAGDNVPRIVIPCLSFKHGGNNLYWQARAMNMKNTVLRYQSPYASRGDALCVLYPFSGVISQPKHLAIVEGPMDALAAADVGLSSVALMGLSPSNEVLESLYTFITKFHVRKILAFADSDYVNSMFVLLNRLYKVAKPPLS